MSNRSLVSYSAVITCILIIGLFIAGGRSIREIEYPQKAAYAGLADSERASYTTDAGQSRTQLMKAALDRCYRQCKDSYYYNTVEFYNACKNTCSEVWMEQ